MTTLERRTLTDQELAEQTAIFGTPADDNHLAVQAHDMDSLDNALATLPPNYGVSSEHETA